MDYLIRHIDKAKCHYAYTSGCSISYVDKNRIEELHKDESILVFADLKKKSNKMAEQALIVQEMTIGLYPYKKFHPPFTNIIGYIPVKNTAGEAGYIRIVSDKRKYAVIGILSIAFLVFIFFCGMWFAEKDEIPNLDKTAVSYHAEGMKNTNPDTIALPGIKRLQAKTDSTLIKSPLINPDGNECYFKYVIELNDSQEVIYESGWLLPGTAIMEFHLNRTLNAGEYDINVNVATRDLNDHKVALNGGIINAKLEVSK